MKSSDQKIPIIALLLFCFMPLFSQELSKREFIKAVQDADIFFYYNEDYETAARLYKSLLVRHPDNNNLSAKLGICYLNIDGRESEALNLLSKASANIVEKDRDYTEFGEQAPLDTYLYLAIAYHKNDSLQKAVSHFYDAKKRLVGTKLFREEYIDLQIRDCMYAIEMKKKPLTMITNLFVPWLAEYPGARNPVLAKNDSVFVFTLVENGKNSILCSYKTGTWGRPVDITRQLGGYDRFFSNSITGDGKKLIIYMDDGGDGNLYYSVRRDSVWTRIKSVGKPINTIYWQSHGFITPDGNAMYFSSNKPGGEGDLDIWFSEKSDDGKWGEPVNCGNVINTPYNEDTPFFDPESNFLIFSSVGHISMGGYDVFSSVNRNGGWTNPTALPFAFNNITDNTFFILNNNAPGFITGFYNQRNHSRNIYSIVAQDPADKITLGKGNITLQDGMNVDPKETAILLTDIRNIEKGISIQLIDSSSFTFEIKPGDYQLIVSHTGYKPDTINLNLPLYFQGSYISVTSSLVPAKVYGGAFLSIKNILFEFDSFTLNEEAKNNLEILNTILVSYPDLYIQIAGYADAIGSTAYNRRLGDKRAQAVIDYLTDLGQPASRFVKKSYGESDFVALNSNKDGSDNPEGRKYNRRATFGIIDPQTGVIIRQNTYTPEHLRQPNSMKYSIILIKTKEKLYPGYFSGLIKNEMLFMRTVKLDTISAYVLGVFSNKSDALQYLGIAREKGLNEAYIVSQYDLDNEMRGIGNADSQGGNYETEWVYTVQLLATRNPVNISRIFVDIEGINEVKAEDGLYKYYHGEFKAVSKAKEALLLMKKSGYEDAFIRQIEIRVDRR